ncbi:hypothetical protein GCM10027456_33830 [Kineosporia babensis]
MRIFGVLAAISVGTSLLPAEGTKASAVAYLISLILSMLFLGTACVRIARTQRGPWLWLMLTLSLALAGETWLKILQLSDPYQWPTPADFFYAATYVPMLIAVLTLERRRGARQQFGALLDAFIVAGSVGVLTLVFLVLPLISDTSEPLLGRLVGSAFPLFDVMITFITARILLSPQGRSRSIWILTGGLVVLIVADNLQNILTATTGGNGFPRWVNLMWLTTYFSFGLAAATFRSAPDSRPQERTAAGLTVPRLAVLSLAAVLPAAVQVFLEVRGNDTGDTYGLPLGIGSIALFALVTLRIWDLLQELHRQAEQLAEVARTDPLTGLANRRSWDFELDRAFATSKAGGTQLLVALLDLDHFKKYNDGHGHQAGDDLLQQAAVAWKAALGTDGVLARWGGEEFAALLHCSDRDAGTDHLDRLRLVVPHQQTCSIGIAHWDGTENPARLLQRADEVLYQAKSGGRNRSILASGPQPDHLERPVRIPAPRTAPEAQSGASVGSTAGGTTL